MPAVWTDASEKRLLLEVIAISKPSVPTAVWARIATAMGENYTGEGCRQKYQSIKRTLKAATDDAPTPTTTPTKSRKRKATKETDNHQDDDEAAAPLFGPHSKSPSSNKKMKKEPNPAATDSNLFDAEVFKAEDAGAEGGVDLERDDLYDDAA
ncbi:hypothetical protein BDR22DRAFT_969065 [Usnea florida]